MTHSDDNFERDIVALHDFFEGWFRGELPRIDEAFTEVDRRLADGFTLVSPRGNVDEREPLLESIRGAYGARGEGFRIWIEDVRVRQSRGDVHVVTYEEWQQEGGAEPTRRLSTAVFGDDDSAPNGLEWLHVHEVWLEVE
jgi:hypothetical protein